MELDELIGWQLAVGFPGTEATDALIEALRRTRAQTLVIFARNVTSPEQFRKLLGDLDSGLDRRLLVMVDHEGGRIIRFASGVTRFPDAHTQARAGVEEVTRQGAVEAEELKALGVHVNLAPCVDVLAKDCDPIIGDRSYGSDPGHVSRLACARIRALQAHGVAACAKHFPGLGAVPKDPHVFLPTITLDWPAMEATHLPPFQAAIEEGVAAIMSSHVCYPSLGDPEGWPATFSHRLITGYLRRQLRFAGVIMTDDLEMGALRAFGTIGEAAVRAAAAGHDLCLICSDLSAFEEALSRLRAAYRAGRLAVGELEASVARVNQLKAQYVP